MFQLSVFYCRVLGFWGLGFGVQGGEIRICGGLGFRDHYQRAFPLKPVELRIFEVWGLQGFRVQGVGFRAQSLGLGVQGLQVLRFRDYRVLVFRDYRVEGLKGLRVSGLRDYRVFGLRELQGLGFRDYRVQGLGIIGFQAVGFRVYGVPMQVF